MNPKYKKMLKGMQAKQSKVSKKLKEKWFLYILRCSDQSLYTGITKDVERRIKMHSDGKGARYTRTRLPLEMVYQETCKNRTEALVRECAIKSLPKLKKIVLIEQFESKCEEN